MFDDQNLPLKIDIAAWVAKAKFDTQQYGVRRVVEVLLTAIGMTANLRDQLYLKGGVLMAIAYESPRMTGDVDFTWLESPWPELPKIIREQLDIALKRATAELGYPDLICRVQTSKERPRPWNTEKPQSFPALEMTIGYALRGSEQEKRLEAGTATKVIQVDISFNEPIDRMQELILNPSGVSVHAYSIHEMIAEKIRALLQQHSESRHPRTRRQDIYDIALLIEQFTFDLEERQQIFKTLISKSDARNIAPHLESLANPQIVKMARQEWDSMKLELGDALPTFDNCYSKVLSFYRSLPWN